MHTQNVLRQNVPRHTVRSKGQNVTGTKRPKDKTSQGQNVPRDKTFQGTKRPRDKTSKVFNASQQLIYFYPNIFIIFSIFLVSFEKKLVSSL